MRAIPIPAGITMMQCIVIIHKMRRYKSVIEISVVMVAVSLFVTIHSNHDCGNNSTRLNVNSSKESPNDTVNNIEVDLLFFGRTVTNEYGSDGDARHGGILLFRSSKAAVLERLLPLLEFDVLDGDGRMVVVVVVVLLLLPLLLVWNSKHCRGMYVVNRPDTATKSTSMTENVTRYSI